MVDHIMARVIFHLPPEHGSFAAVLTRAALACTPGRLAFLNSAR
jgi:hypothetical protein